VIAGRVYPLFQSAASLAAPAGLAAVAASTTAVTVTWSGSTGATAYELVRTSDGINFTTLSGTATSPYTDSTVSAGHAYVYKVRATNSTAASAFSNSDFVTTFVYTDNPLAAASTPIRAIHITELRQAVDAIRVAVGLSAGTYTDLVIQPGLTVVRAIHVQELRTQVNAPFTAVGLTPPTYTDDALQAGSSVIKSAHVQELRTATRCPAP